MRSDQAWASASETPARKTAKTPFAERRREIVLAAAFQQFGGDFLEDIAADKRFLVGIDLRVEIDFHQHANAGPAAGSRASAQALQPAAKNAAVGHARLRIDAALSRG